jgi:hypothetical protein
MALQPSGTACFGCSIIWHALRLYDCAPCGVTGAVALSRRPPRLRLLLRVILTIFVLVNTMRRRNAVGRRNAPAHEGFGQMGKTHELMAMMGAQRNHGQ